MTTREYLFAVAWETSHMKFAFHGPCWTKEQNQRVSYKALGGWAL